MKKLILSLLSFAALGLSAQPVLTTTSPIGYIGPIAQASAATVPLVPTTTTGANVTWDCSGLLPEAGLPNINFTVSAPAGTAYAADYPQSNWYFTDPALVNVIGHHYYTLTADSFVLWGAHTMGQPYEICDNPELELVFPLAYNQTSANSYSKTNYNAGGGVSSYQTGTNTITYDGYGTLILPGGTYNNVVQVSRVRTNSLGPTLNSKSWYQGATGERILLWEEKDAAPPHVVYKATIVNQLAQVEASKNLKVSTEPGSGIIHIQASKGINRVSLYSATGALLKTIPTGNATQYSLPAQYARGMYILTVETEGQVISSKIVL